MASSSSDTADTDMSTHEGSVVGKLLAEKMEEDTFFAEEFEILDDIIQESSPVDFSPPLKYKSNIILKNVVGGTLSSEVRLIKLKVF